MVMGWCEVENPLHQLAWFADLPLEFGLRLQHFCFLGLDMGLNLRLRDLNMRLHFCLFDPHPQLHLLLFDTHLSLLDFQSGSHLHLSYLHSRLHLCLFVPHVCLHLCLLRPQLCLFDFHLGFRFCLLHPFLSLRLFFRCRDGGLLRDLLRLSFGLHPAHLLHDVDPELTVAELLLVESQMKHEDVFLALPCDLDWHRHDPFVAYVQAFVVLQLLDYPLSAPQEVKLLVIAGDLLIGESGLVSYATVEVQNVELQTVTVHGQVALKA